MKQSIQIDTFYEVERAGIAGKLISVNREVRVDNELVYQSKMSPRIYLASEDPIRNLEKYVLGLKEREGTDNTISNTTDKISFFKHIRLKLFGKKI